MPALKKRPQLKGICTKIFNRTPKKPNSALTQIRVKGCQGPGSER